MPYQVKAGSLTVIVANEQQAIDALSRMIGSGRESASIRDVFGSEIDLELLRSKIRATDQPI
jgi:hypothetical protein